MKNNSCWLKSLSFGHKKYFEIIYNENKEAKYTFGSPYKLNVSYLVIESDIYLEWSEN